MEVALVTTEFATEILGEILDNNGVLVEKNDAEPSQFALMFEFIISPEEFEEVQSEMEKKKEIRQKIQWQYNIFCEIGMWGLW